MLNKSALLLPISGIKPTHWIIVDSDDDTRGVRVNKVASSRGIMRVAPEKLPSYQYGFTAQLANSALTPLDLEWCTITGLWTYLTLGIDLSIVRATNYLTLHDNNPSSGAYDRGTWTVYITRLDTKRQLTVTTDYMQPGKDATFKQEWTSTAGSEEGRFFTLADKGKTIPLVISGPEFHW